MEQIALEKSGIIKPGGRVVLYPQQQPGVEDIIRGVCAGRGADLYIPDMTKIAVLSEDIEGTEFQAEGLRLRTPFLGEHQVKNAAVALELVKILRERGFDISDESLAEGFKKAFIPARMEIISKDPLCLLDGGHNPGCALVLKDALERYVPGPRTAIMGMMADKDSVAALEILGPMFSKIITVKPENPRSLSAEDLAKTAARFCPEAVPAASFKEALDLAVESGGALIACGSFYMAGELRPLLLEKFTHR